MPPGGIDFGGIGTVITALTGVLLTLGTVLSSRQRHSQINAGAAMEEAAQRATQFQATARHVGYLESILAENGLVAPPRPVEMSAAWWARAIGLDTGGAQQSAAPSEQGGNGGAQAAPAAGPIVRAPSGGHRRHAR